MSHSLQVQREQLSLQVQFAEPVFELFKEFPALVRHLFRTLGHHGLRLTDVRLDSPGESLGEVNLQLSWTELNTSVRVFLDRIELTSAYPPFIYARDGSLVADLLETLTGYSSDLSYRAFGVTQEAHGVLDVPIKEFLQQFSSEAPSGLGPSLGTGTVFYFGAEHNRFASSIALDLSRMVDGGLFLKLVTIYDATQVAVSDLIPVARAQLFNLLDEVGLGLIGG
jgi:hypothetical protein